MKSSKLIAFIGFITIALGTGCAHKPADLVAKQVNTDSAEVFVLKPGQIDKEVIFPAELTPLERAEIYAKVSGYINDFKADIGDHIKKGEMLITLDAPEVISNYAQASADVQAAYARYLSSHDTYTRILKASSTAGTISPEETEKAKNVMLADSSVLEASRSKLNANSQIKNYLTIRAPFDGIITARNFDRGTLVGSNNTKPLLILENIAKLRLRISVPEAYSMSMPDTSVVRFSVDAQPGKLFSADLTRKSGSINLQNRTEIWEYIFLNKDNQLKSGMYATAAIRFRRRESSFIVPESAVVTNLEKKLVIRLKDNKTELVDVKSGISQGDKVEIFGNISDGDLLLLKATDEIKSGMRLIPKIKR
jgi:membrane fusion protein, multidrug efflux system